MKRRKFFKDIADSLKRAFGEFTFEVSKPIKTYVRPPGSGSEADFLAKCSRCSKCIEVCPTGILDKVKELNPMVLDTPFMNFENGYCEKCYRCIEVCPTEALSKENLKKYRYAVSFDKSKCAAYKGMFCQTCYWSCPNMDKAITLRELRYPEFHVDLCDGCGRCINACPAEGKPIKMKRVKVEEDD